MTNFLDNLLLSNTENEIVEYKEAKTNFDLNKLGKYFSAISNEANLKGVKGGYLIFGISDSRKVVGTKYRLTAKELLSLKKEIADKTTNRITFVDIHEIQHDQGRVLVFEIPSAPSGMPIAWNGHYYGRDGESLSPLNISEMERIRAQTKLQDWSAVILPEASIDDLDETAISIAREKYFKKNPKLIDEASAWSVETFLNKAKLAINGKITRATILLLGKPRIFSLVKSCYRHNNLDP